MADHRSNANQTQSLRKEEGHDHTSHHNAASAPRPPPSPTQRRQSSGTIPIIAIVIVIIPTAPCRLRLTSAAEVHELIELVIEVCAFARRRLLIIVRHAVSAALKVRQEAGARLAELVGLAGLLGLGKRGLAL